MTSLLFASHNAVHPAPLLASASAASDATPTRERASSNGSSAISKRSPLITATTQILHTQHTRSSSRVASPLVAVRKVEEEEEKEEVDDDPINSNNTQLRLTNISSDPSATVAPPSARVKLPSLAPASARVTSLVHLVQKHDSISSSREEEKRSIELLSPPESADHSPSPSSTSQYGGTATAALPNQTDDVVSAADSGVASISLPLLPSTVDSSLASTAASTSASSNSARTVVTSPFAASTFAATAPLSYSTTVPPPAAASFSSTSSSIDSPLSSNPPELAPSDSTSSLPLVKPSDHRPSVYTSSLRRVSLTSDHDTDDTGVAAHSPLSPNGGGAVDGSSRTSTSFSMSPHSPTAPLVEHRNVTVWQLVHHALEGSAVYKCLLTLCILYVFFADDIRLLCSYSAAADNGVLAGYVLCIVCLLCDIAIRAASSPTLYFLSPLFLYELAGSILILLYLPPLYPSSVSRLWLSSVEGRAIALSGALPLMCRLIGVWMLDNWVKKAYRAWEELSLDKTEREEEKEEREEGKRIRTQLAQHTSITVVTGAICMLMLSAYLEYDKSENAPFETAQLLQQQLQAGQGGVQQFVSYWGNTLLYLQLNSSTIVDQRTDRLPGLRSDQIITYTSSASSAAYSPTSLSVLFYDDTLSTNAAWNLYRTLFVLTGILVTFAFAAFGSHSVIVPLERAVQAVNNLIADPLADLVRMNGKRTSTATHSHRTHGLASTNKPLTETQLVSSTLLKLARLLQVGFGDAGAEIIAKNLHGDLSFLDPMIPGRKIYGIFGFCSLSHFELCTEVLEEEVMVFVNQVAEIIHGVCHRHGGQVNRSLGPSFLMVWKLRMDREGRVGTAGGANTAAAGGGGGETSVGGQVSMAGHHRTHTTLLRTRRGSNSTSASVHPSPVSPPHERPGGHRSTYSITRTSLKSGWSLFDREGRRGRMGKIDEQEERERNKERERAKRRGVKVGAKPATAAAAVKEDEAATTAATVGREGGGADHMRSVSFDPHSLYSPYSRDDLHSPAVETDDEDKDDETRIREKGRRTLMRGVYGGQSMASLTGDGESATDVLMEGDEEDENESDFHRQQTGATDAGPADSLVQRTARAMSLTPSTVHLPLTPTPQATVSPQPAQRQLDEPLISPAHTKPSKRRHSLHASDAKLGEAKAKMDEHKVAATEAVGGDDKLLQQRARNQFRRHSLPPRKSDEDTRTAAVSTTSVDDEKEHAGARRQPVLGLSSRTHHREGSRPQPIVIPSSSFITRIHPSSPPPAPSSSFSATHLTPNSSALPASSLPSAMRLGQPGANPRHRRDLSTTSSMTLPHSTANAAQLLGATLQPGNANSSPHHRSLSTMQSAARGGLQPLSASRRTSSMPVHRASTLSLSKLSDQALIAFLHTTMSILTAPSLSRWRKHKAMVSRLSSFSVNVSFGLHVGWAIEGAIGSVCKIDASYLSPHVNSSSRLMMACKQYHVSLLMSEQFYLLLHPAIRTRCRHIDRVLLKGVADAMNVYTFDISVKDKEMKSKVIKHFIEDDDDDGDSERREKSQSGKLTSYLYSLLSMFTSSTTSSANSSTAASSSNSHSDDVVNSRLFSALSALQSGLPVNFIPIYNRAVSSYLDGDWAAAKEALYSVMEMWPDDESALSLFRFMESEQREWKEKERRKSGVSEEEAAVESGKEKAPGDWKGYRELKKK